MIEAEFSHDMTPGFRKVLMVLCTTFVLISGACSYPASDVVNDDEPTPGIAVEVHTPRSTPPGITLVDMMKEQSSSQAMFIATRLGTETGDPLFVPETDDLTGWTCNQQCAENNTPFLAVPGTLAFGSWSVGEIEGEQFQWLYHGQPLFRRLDSPEADEETDKEEGGIKAAEGLTLALYGLERQLQGPPTITVRQLPVAGGQALVTTNRETIYFFLGEPRGDSRDCGEEPCFAKWKVVEAPMMARAIGEFAPVQRPDGLVQWAYAGKPLYTFREDFAPGQVNGANQSEYWKVALLTRDYRPENVVVGEIAGQGHFLSTADGRPLYNRLPFRHRFGGRNSYEGFIHNEYEEGKKLGTGGCDEACLKTWKPFLAPSDSQITGYWEIFERPDGSQQWAYQGYALYTNVSNNGPENMVSTKLYEPLIGSNARYDLAKGVAFNGVGKAAGLNWHLAKP